jgi:quinol-cytochrome oxidoreductase complex cytochrome b subunit
MRYLILVLLNVPVILLALVNIVAQYKMKRISAARFRHQVVLWLVILVVLVSSFPIYNYLSGNRPFDSSELSLFDIVQTTAIVYMVYSINDHRRKIEQNERVLRELHQELSIKLAGKDD